MTIKNKILFGSLATLPFMCSGVAFASDASKSPNVVLLLTDQWRKQALGFMGEDPVQTPNIDKLATWGVSFDNAVATNPVSGPNRACILTGKYTINNGTWANGVPVDPNEESSVGRLFKDAGYATGYIGKWHMNGLDDMVVDPSRRQGFDYWYQSMGHGHFKSWYYAPHIDKDKKFQIEAWGPTHETNLAIDFIDDKKGDNNPFCLMVSYAPPHTGGGVGFEDRYQPGKKMKRGYGYAGPAEFEAIYTDDYSKNKIRPNIKPTGNYEGTDDYAHAVPGYFGAVTSIDHEIGRIIDHLEANNLLENTIIVVTADHGEMMGSHGLMTKGVPFEESVGVPMLFAWRGKIKAERHKCIFNSIDILPTLVESANLEIPESTDGTSYAPLLLRGRQNTPKYAFTQFNFGGVGEKCRPWRSVVSEDFVYVLVGESKLKSGFFPEGYALFDMKKDPYQLNPILKNGGYDKIIDKYHNTLIDHLASLGDDFINSMWAVDELPMKPSLNKENFDPNYKKMMILKNKRKK